jgi:hypothetical protein
VYLIAAILCLLLIPLIAVAQRNIVKKENKTIENPVMAPVKLEEVKTVEIEKPIEKIQTPQFVSQSPKIDTNLALSEWLFELRSCESTNNYQSNTGNGFFGAYQFMISTWDRIAPMAGRPDLVGVRPDLASPADQDYMIVQNTILSKGGLSSQNPGCYKSRGLSNKPPAQ